MSAALIAGMGVAKDQEGPLTGTWDCQSKGGPDGDMGFTLYLEQNGENVDGSVSSPIGSAQLSEGKFKGSVLEFQIEAPDGNYVLNAKLVNDTLSGTWTFGENKGTWDGKKEKTAAK
jgi:hypothetical protein